MKLSTKLYRLGRKIFDKNGLAQEKTIASGEKYHAQGMPQLCRRAAAEGIVLLENDGVLPLERGCGVAVFGRCQLDYFCVGYGSGGDVKAPYCRSFADGMLARAESGDISYDEELFERYKKWTSAPANQKDDGFWGHWPMNYPEMRLRREWVREAAARRAVAVVVIGRAAGEDRENKCRAGSYYLTAVEREMLKEVCAAFEKTVLVLDCGNIIDLKFVKEYPFSAVVYAWHGGMEAGNAVWDILCGITAPCGKLTDTVAKEYAMYPSSENFGGKKYNNYAEDIFVGYRYFETFAPENVLYPFGFGLTYTKFSVDVLSAERSEGKTILRVCVTNVGARAGKEVVQVYAGAPQGRLSKPSKVLVGFAKSRLLQKGESEQLVISFTDYDCAAYDDAAHRYVLEAGEYNLFVGTDVRSAQKAGSFFIEKELVLCQLSPVCGVKKPFFRLANRSGKAEHEKVPAAEYSLKERIERSMPQEIGFRGDRGYLLSDVAEGKISLEDFIAQLSDRELEGLSRGCGEMNVAEGTPGNAGGFGGTMQSLKEKGVPVVVVCDGPSGIRLNRYASLLPCGTAIASSWDPALAEELYAKVAQELAHYGVDVLLAPGMNIHRDPLCGRNFEYYSEDPRLTGKIAAAAVRGIEREGRSACIKHFACNNQEKGRSVNDSRVSERALREIYLKGFEICIKESAPRCLMVSYNKINGVWSHYNYDLVQTVARGEWGFRGVVLTDWWIKKSKSPEFAAIRTNAYRIRSGADVLMPGNLSGRQRGYAADVTALESLGKQGGIRRAELEAVAKNVLGFILESGALRR